MVVMHESSYHSATLLKRSSSDLGEKEKQEQMDDSHFQEMTTGFNDMVASLTIS